MKVYVLKTKCNHDTGIGIIIGITQSISEANTHNDKDSSNEYQELELQTTTD